MTRAWGTWLTAGIAGVVAAGTLAGCSEDRPAADGAARELAQGLSQGSLEKVAFDGTTPAKALKQWDSATEGMGAEPRVRVGDVTEDGESAATATLSYTWDLPSAGKSWTYDTKVALSYREEEWLVRWAPDLVAPDLRKGETLAIRETPAQRATIDGAGGSHLVMERPVLRFGVDKTKVTPAQQPGSARALARLVGIDAGGYVREVAAAGEKAFVEAIVLRASDLSPRIGDGYDQIPGVVALGDELSLAPTRDFARPLLGTVGEATAEMIQKSEGRLTPGDEAGLSGLQARYDEQLGGTDGVQVLARPAKPEDPNVSATEPRTLFEVAPVDGKPLATTLDVNLQLLAEELLAGVRPASALVAVRPSTGDLVAVASGPGGEGYSTATVGQYAPGSTFKVVSTLALLRAGLGEGSPVPCTPTITVEGKAFKNYDDYPAGGLGRIPLRTAIANSCNTAFISQRDRLSQDSLADAAAALGLGVDRDLGFPAFLGSVPADMTGTDLAASTIGQGRVLASPLAMAAVAASVARGEAVVPRLLPDLAPPPSPPRTPVTAAEAATLRDLMRAVVTEGSASFLAGVPGPPVAAKTGTAEFGTKLPLQTHGWMIAIQGDLAVAVFVDVAESGSRTAGPVLEGFLRRAR